MLITLSKWTQISWYKSYQREFMNIFHFQKKFSINWWSQHFLRKNENYITFLENLFFENERHSSTVPSYKIWDHFNELFKEILKLKFPKMAETEFLLQDFFERYFKMKSENIQKCSHKKEWNNWSSQFNKFFAQAITCLSIQTNIISRGRNINFLT